MDFIYKKISLENIIKKITKSNKENRYKVFFQRYITNYLSKFKINSQDDFIKSNLSQLQFYNKYDKNCKIYFHILSEKKSNKIIAIEKGLQISELFFDIKYFKQLINLCPKQPIIYATNLYVDEEFRGKSLCKLLLNRIKKNTKKHLINCIISEIHNINIPSIKCHESVGFTKTKYLSYPSTHFFINLI